MITLDRLRELLHYEPSAGVFVRRARTSQNMRTGDVAGTLMKSGYCQIGLDGRYYYAHRLAVFYMTGRWPTAQVDHIDGVRANNRWSNLREATAAMNQQNLRRAMKNSRTGLLGVSPSFGKFEAAIMAGGRKHRLGRFDTPQEAHAVYIAAKRKLHGACTI